MTKLVSLGIPSRISTNPKSVSAASQPDLDQTTDSVRAIKRGIVLAFNPPRDGDLIEVDAAASDRPLASRCHQAVCR
jgi:hypothetical protein